MHNKLNVLWMQLILMVPMLLMVSVSNVMACDYFANAERIPDLPFTSYVNTSAATVSPDDPTNCYVPFNTVWYQGTAGADKVVEANTFGSDYDTTLTVVTGSPGSFTLIACNDDSGISGNETQSQVIFNVVTGETYYFMVGSKVAGGGNLVFNVNNTTEQTTTTVEPATINGIVFDDTNQDGALDPGETGIPDVTVILDDTTTQTTDGDGNYSFSGVANGTHKLSVTEPTGYFLTTNNNPYTFDVTGLASVNFGFALMTTTSTTTTTEEPTTTTTTVPTTTTTVPTTTTTVPEEECTVTVRSTILPLRAGLLPHVRRIVITGENSNWDRTSAVSIEDIPIVIPLRKQPTKIYALIVIPSTLFGRFTPGEKGVGVATGAELCTGTVDIP